MLGLMVSFKEGKKEIEESWINNETEKQGGMMKTKTSYRLSMGLTDAINRQDYQAMASLFLQDTNTTMKAEFVKHDKHFDTDTHERDIYRITLKRGTRKYSFSFGQSINASGKYWKYGDYKRGVTNKQPIPSCDWDINKDYKIPTEYDVLACLTKYKPGTFEDFCSDFGYDTDSKTAEKTYKVVVKEYDMVCKLWNDKEIETLQEIN